MILINKTARMITLPSGVALIPTQPTEIPDYEAEVLKRNPVIKAYQDSGLLEFKSGGSSSSSLKKDTSAPVIENQRPTITSAQRLPVFDKSMLEEIPSIGTKGAEKVLANQPDNGYVDVDAMAAANAEIPTIDWAKVRTYLNK